MVGIFQKSIQEIQRPPLLTTKKTVALIPEIWYLGLLNLDKAIFSKDKFLKIRLFIYY